MNIPQFPQVVVEGFPDSSQVYLIQSLIQKNLRKWILQGGDLYSFLPLVEMEFSPQSENRFCLFLVSYSMPGIEKFFSEMASKWLLPGEKKVLYYSFYTQFALSTDLFKKLSFCELRFFFEEKVDFDDLFRSFNRLAPEIKLGVSSPYQAQRILEQGGLFDSEKNSFIQDRIASLIQKRPQDFDYDVFGQMQHFFLSSEEEFKKTREHPHLSRIVYVFYLFRKRLKKVAERAPDKRHVSFKISQVRIHQPFGLRKVLGVFVGINFLKPNEIFEKKHVEKAIQEHLPDATVVGGSLFVYLHKEEKIQILYLEVQRKNGEEFSSNEMRLLRKQFPHALEHQIEKLMPTLYMPRNEEEVMKNIIRLSQEVRYLKDIPQVIISFEEQTDQELVFTVILVRLLLKESLSIRELFSRTRPVGAFIEDRVKLVGFVRRKYPKEATVFRLKFPKLVYVRNDHTVDLLKARHSVVLSLEAALGEFRDYNGGMISKQAETLSSFKSLLSSSHNVGAEEFFNSLYPVELRSVVAPSFLKILYDLWFLRKKDFASSSFDYVFCKKEVLAVLVCFEEEEVKKNLSQAIKDLGLSSSQWIMLDLKKGSLYYQGYLLMGSAISKSDEFLSKIQKIKDQFEVLV